MDFPDVALLIVAGFAAGAINVVVGSGSLITFPALLAVGYPPVIANVTNNVGIFPGAVSGVFGYRRELSRQARRIKLLGICTICGSSFGCFLLLRLPSSVFAFVVPILIISACVLILLQPYVLRWRSSQSANRPLLAVLIFLSSIYGGYFGAAQTVVILGLLGVLLPDTIQRSNALKNVLGSISSGTAVMVFIFASHIEWASGLTIAVGSIVGAQVGARIALRLRAGVLRAVVVIVGFLAAGLITFGML